MLTPRLVLESDTVNVSWVGILLTGGTQGNPHDPPGDTGASLAHTSLVILNLHDLQATYGLLLYVSCNFLLWIFIT